MEVLFFQECARLALPLQTLEQVKTKNTKLYPKTISKTNTMRFILTQVDMEVRN